MADSKLRLCVLTPVHSAVQMGGAEYQIDCLLDALLPTARYDVDYLAALTAAESPERGYRIHRIGNGTIPRFGFLMHMRPLLRTLRDVRPQVIYQRVACGYTGLAAFYARKHGARLIWHIAHDQDVTPGVLAPGRNFVRNILEKQSIEYGIRHAHHIVAQTDRQARLLQQHYGRTADAVIPNFHPDPQETPDKSGPLTILWIANLKPWKQPEIFLRLARALSDLPDVSFVMVGAPATGSGDREWARNLTEAIDATPNLAYLGVKSQNEINALLARAHVFVNTSLYEGFPNTFIQAWQREVPVVSLNVNPDGVLERQRIGVCAKSEEELHRAVRSLVLDPSGRAEMGTRARVYAKEQHSLRNAQRLADLVDAAA